MISIVTTFTIIKIWVIFGDAGSFGGSQLHKNVLKDENLLSNYEKWFEEKCRHGKHHCLLKNSSKSEAKTQKCDSALWTAMYKICLSGFPNLYGGYALLNITHITLHASTSIMQWFWMMLLG